jgi:VanZ family protein
MKLFVNHFGQKSKIKVFNMLNKKLIFTLLFWGLLAAVTFFLLLEVKPAPQTWPKDKLEHALIFALLTYLGVKSHPKHTLSIVLGLAIYGGLMEQAQSLLTQTRTGSMGDWLADLIGVAFAFYALNLHKKSAAL